MTDLSAIHHWLPSARDILRILLDSVVKSVAMLAVAGLAVVCMRRRSAAARHLICFLAVVSLPVLPVLSWVLPGWRVLPGWMDVREEKPAVAERQAKTSATAAASVEGSPNPERLGGSLALPAQMDSSEQVPSPAVQSVAAPRSAPEHIRINGWRAGLMAWLAGAALALAPAILGVLSLHFLERTSRRETGASWLELVGQLLTRLGFKRRVVLLKAAQRRMPMTWGVLCPKVLLPEESEQWPHSRRSVVLLHELAHAQRYDYLTHLIARLVCALYWFNPLVWLLAGRMVAERERACDDIVLRHGAEPTDYAEQVLEISAGLSTGWLAGCGGVAMARPSNLESRLRAILDAKRNRAALTRAAVLSALLLLTVILVPVAMLKAAPTGNGQSPVLEKPSSSELTNRTSGQTTTNEVRYAAEFVPEKTEIAVGEPIYLDLHLTNTSGKTFLMLVGNVHASDKIQAFDANGEMFTNGLPHYNMAEGPMGATPIEPGGVFHERSELPWYVKFEKPGEYTLVASRQISIYESVVPFKRTEQATIGWPSNAVGIIDSADFTALRSELFSHTRITNRFKLSVRDAAVSKRQASLPASSVAERIDRLIQGAPFVTNRATEIWEPAPGQPGGYKVRPGVAQYYYYNYNADDSRFLFCQVFHLAANNHFYIQLGSLDSRGTLYYGPFAGDPFRVLGKGAPITAQAAQSSLPNQTSLTNPKRVEPDNPLGIDDETIVRFFQTGKALQNIAMRAGGLPSSVPVQFPKAASVEDMFKDYINRDELGNDPFGNGKLRLDYSETNGKTMARVFSVGPDGVWDGGKPIHEPDLRGDLGLEIEAGKSEIHWLAEGAILDYLKGTHTARYLAKRATRAATPSVLPQAADAKLNFGPVVDGLQAAVGLTTTDGVFLLGQPIEVHFHIQNASDHEIQIAGVSWRQDDEMILEAEEGGPVLNKYGAKPTVGINHYSGWPLIERETLGPGQTAVLQSSGLELLPENFTNQPTAPIGHYTSVPPGRYRIHFKLRFDGWNAQLMDWQGYLETGPVTIEVKEAGFHAANVTPADKDWGEPTNGVSLRLMADKVAWKTGETPTLRFSLNNRSPNDVGWTAIEERGELEVDGVWHHYFYAGRDIVTPILAAGRQEDGYQVNIGSDWRKGAWRLAELDESGTELKILPGKHTVRLALIAATIKPNGSDFRVVSNPIEIEIGNSANSGTPGAVATARIPKSPETVLAEMREILPEDWTCQLILKPGEMEESHGLVKEPLFRLDFTNFNFTNVGGSRGGRLPAPHPCLRIYFLAATEKTRFQRGGLNIWLTPVIGVGETPDYFVVTSLGDINHGKIGLDIYRAISPMGHALEKYFGKFADEKAGDVLGMEADGSHGLTASSGFAGQVVDDQTGRPIKEFHIQISADDPQTRGNLFFGGRFGLEGVALGTIGGNGLHWSGLSLFATGQKAWPRVQAEGYLPAPVTSEPVAWPVKLTNLVVRLKRQ